MTSARVKGVEVGVVREEIEELRPLGLWLEIFRLLRDALVARVGLRISGEYAKGGGSTEQGGQQKRVDPHVERKGRACNKERD